MNKLYIGFFTIFFILAGLNLAETASAQYYYNYGRTPSLTVSQDSSNIRVNVSNADPNSRVVLYARPLNTTSWSTIIDPIGQTDQSGYLSVSLNPGIIGSAEYKVAVNGTDSNVAQSGNTNCGYYGCGGCTYNCGNPGTLSLSKTYVTLNIGQSESVTAYPQSGAGGVYVSSNYNSSVVSASVSGNQINLYGLMAGSSTITVCLNDYSYSYLYNNSCASIIVNVSGYSGGSGGNLWFSPSSPTMYQGQSLAVSINSSVSASGYYYSNNAYYISSNSNSSAVTATVSGTVLNLYANQNGSSTITVCHSSLNFCGNIYVTVSGGGTTGQMTFSPSSPSLAVGQNLAVSIFVPYMYSGSYYVASNSNSGVVSASVSGSTLNLYGLSGGSSNISVCQQTGGCGNVSVTVTGGSGYGNLWFSPSSVNMSSGQVTNVNIYSSSGYYGGYYISSNSNSFVAAASISGSQIALTAQNSGSTTIMVCQSGNSSTCGNIVVTVSGGYGNNLTFSQNNLNLTSGQTANITVYGNGGYYISSNSNSNVATASLSGNNISVYANNSGNAAIVVCQNSQYACGTLMVNVSGSNYGGGLTFSTTVLPVMTVGQYYNYQLVVYGGSAPYNFYLVSGSLPLGLNLSNSGQIYGTVQNSAYASFAVKASDNYGRSATANFTISGSGGGVLGISTYPNGQLIKENGTVYLIYRGQKSGFSSASVFTNFGFKFSNVLNTGFTGIPNTGYIISNSNTSHPWGAWVQSGSAIYFVHQDGLIPVPSWDVFINNRGSSSFVVPANMYDFQRPMLSVMGSNDPRLY